MNYFMQSRTRDVLRRGRIRCLQRGAMSELCVRRLWRWRVASEPVLLTATRRRGRVLLPGGVGTAAHSSRTPDGRKMLFSLQYPCLVHTEPAGWIRWRVRSRWCPWLWKELQTCRVWYWITSDLPCVAMFFPTVAADSLMTFLHTADDQQWDSHALQSTEF